MRTWLKNDTKKSANIPRAAKQGGYSALLSLTVAAALVVGNLLVHKLPERFRQWDLSSEGLYTLSDATKEVLDSLDRDVTIYTVAEPDTVDDRIQKLVERYGESSGHVTSEVLDPVLHPSSVSSMNAEAGSLLVRCEATGKSQTIPFAEIIKPDLMAYYSYGQYVESEFDGEGQITSAISQVSRDVRKKIYTTSGHREDSFSSEVLDLMQKSSLDTAQVDLLKDGRVPEDCELLILNNPQSDLSGDEKGMILSYLKSGGNALIVAGPSDRERPNLQALLEQYNLRLKDGYVADPKNFYQNNPYWIAPVCDYAGEVMQGVDSGENAMILNGAALSLADPEETSVTVTPFLKTSNEGVAVTEDGQETGTWYIGVTAEKAVEGNEADGNNSGGTPNGNGDGNMGSNGNGNPDDNGDGNTGSGSGGNPDDNGDGNTGSGSDAGGNPDSASQGASRQAAVSRLTVISAPSLIDEQLTGRFSNLSNLTIFMNAVTANFDDISNISIPAKSLSVERNMVTHGGMWGSVLLFIIPVICLFTGFVVWYRRRKM